MNLVVTLNQKAIINKYARQQQHCNYSATVVNDDSIEQNEVKFNPI